VWVLSESPPEVRVARGAREPFRGWVHTGTETNPQPAPALEIRPRGDDALVVTVFHFEPASGKTAPVLKPRVQRQGAKWSVSFADGLELSASLGSNPSAPRLIRRGVESNASSSIQPLSCPADVQQASGSQRAALSAEFGQSSARPRVPLTRYRDVSLLLVGIYLAQELGVLLIRRKSQRLVGLIRLCSCAVLIGAAILLTVRWWGTVVA
jgi:hypothetical protein